MAQGLLFEATFDHGAVPEEMGFRGSGSPTSIVDAASERALQSLIHHGTSPVPFRAEVQPTGLPASHFNEGMFAHIGGEYWYGMFIHMPATWKADGTGENLVQFHAVPDAGESDARNPPVSLQVAPEPDGFGHLQLRVRADDRPLIPDLAQGYGEARYQQSQEYDLGPVEAYLGRWTEWVWHVRWNHDGSGFLQLFRDGQLVVDRPGANSFNDLVGGPYLKLGLYKPDWQDPAATGADDRIVFYDDLRIADATGTHALVTGHAMPPSLPPAPTEAAWFG